MKKTVFLVAILMILSTMGVANASAIAAASGNPFDELGTAITNLTEKVSQLFIKTDDLQQQVNSIGARDTSVVVNNNVPVPNVTITNNESDVTIINNITLMGNNATQTDSFFNIFVQVQSQRLGFIDGEVQERQYENWIEAKSYKYKIDTPVDPISGLPTGRLQVSGFTITKEQDKASPLLALSLASGDNLRNARIVLVKKDTGEKYLEYVLSDAIISSIDTTGDARASEERPLEDVTFNYQKMAFIYTMQKDGQPVNVQVEWQRSSPSS